METALEAVPPILIGFGLAALILFYLLPKLFAWAVSKGAFGWAALIICLTLT